MIPNPTTNDRIFTSGGDDTICGGASDDTMGEGNVGWDTVASVSSPVATKLQGAARAITATLH